MNISMFKTMISGFNFEEETKRQLIEQFSHLSGLQVFREDLRDTKTKENIVEPPISFFEDKTIDLDAKTISPEASTADMPESDTSTITASQMPSVPASGFEMLGILGQGGMGEIRLVLDKRLNRKLAMKVLHQDLLMDAAECSRFLEEAQICAQLQHPNIVPVHEVGKLPDGRLYFTMKVVEGRRLTDVIRAVHRAVVDGRFEATADGWTFHRLIDVLHQICQAVAYAHSKGVLHRDLKPSNIMLGRFGEVLVLDWGIAKVLGTSSSFDEKKTETRLSSRRNPIYATQVGKIAGTPSYMAPEQARGEIDALSVKTDIYALGTILYEILSGHPPYRANSPEAILDLVQRGDEQLFHRLSNGSTPVSSADNQQPVPPRPQLPVELINACEKAMSRLQADRYSTVEELSDLLQAWLEGSKKREEALRMLKEADELSLQSKMLKEEGLSLLEKTEKELQTFPGWETERTKGALWAKEKKAYALQREGQRLEVDVEFRLQSALSHKHDLVEGHEVLVQRYLQAHQQAEQVKEEESIIHSEIRLRHHAMALPEHNPLRQQALHYLKGTGAVSLVTDVDGVDIFLDKYVPHHRRLMPERIDYLGNQGLRSHPLEMGSYRLVLQKEGYHDVIYPVYIERGEHWDGLDPSGAQRPIVMPKLGSISADECYVPAGWFWAGGDKAATHSLERKKIWVDSFISKKFPVTNRDYLVFLNDLLKEGREEDALKWVLRERSGQAGLLGKMIYGRNENGEFILVPDADGDIWGLDWPVLMIDWHRAMAYASWKEQRSGLPWRLLHEVEWEKSARGVDGRFFPWGDGFDPSYACMRQSHKRRELPNIIDSFPIDESVYGARGLAGNTLDWTTSVWAESWAGIALDNGTIAPGSFDSAPHLRRVTRGGSWGFSSRDLRISRRNLNDPTHRSSCLGFRIGRSAFASDST